MNHHKTGFWIAALAVMLAATSPAQTNLPTTNALPSVKKLMSHDDFVKAGLTKLNDEEIKALDAWLQNYLKDNVKTNQPATTRELTLVHPKKIDEAVIETQIDGDFEGWDGETIWKMENGQIWQQSSYSYHYHYASDPKVLIYRSGGGWKMKVDGDDETVDVKKLK